MIGSTLGHYRIDALLGEGGMGTVYEAFDTTLRRPAALKVLGPNVLANDEAMRRFLAEARNASRLSHPNVVTIYEVGAIPGDQGAHFIAMELVKGETLASILTRGPVEVSRTLDWMAQVADGIGAAHAAGIIHRDLKPENIVVSESGFVKILDFGLAKLHAAPDMRASTAIRTTPGIVLGTVCYMSPEQARGQAMDARTDIFSMGCILYECLSGRLPFEADTAIDTMHQVIYAEPPPLPDSVPAALQQLVAKCLAKDREQRLQSAAELAAALRQIGSTPHAAVPPRKRARLWIASAIAAVVIATAVAGVVVLRRETAPQPISITRVTALNNVIGAAISPDGEYVGYGYSEAGLHSVWVRQVATGSALQVVPPAKLELMGAKFTPDSRSMVYTSHGELYQVPVLGGTPRRLLGNAASAVAFSPDGRQMAFHRAAGDVTSIVITNADGTGERTLITRRAPEILGSLFFSGTEWSPDGTSIASALRTASSARLIAVDVTTGAARTVLGNVADVGSMAWLRDDEGEAIVAAVTEHAGSPAQLWLIDPESGAHRPITNDLFDYRTVTVTRDGKTLVAVAADILSRVWSIDANGHAARLTSGRSDGSGGVAVGRGGTVLYTAPEEGKWRIWRGSEAVSGTNISAAAPALTPDGRFIVFTLFREHDAVLARMNAADGSGLRVLCPVAAERIPLPASITPDGKWVYFGSSRALWRVSIDGGQPARVAPFEADRPAVSPDGTRLAFRLPGAYGVMPIGGGPVQRFANITRTSFSSVRWSADGRALLHNSGVGDRNNLWIQPLDGSPPRKLTNFDDDYVLTFDVGPDGTLAVVRGTLSRDAVLIRNFR